MNDTYEKDLAMESMERDELSEDDLEQVSGGSFWGFLSDLFGISQPVNDGIGSRTAMVSRNSSR